MHIIHKILCKLGRHRQSGFVPIGDPGNVRCICYRCKRVWLVSGSTVCVIDSADDPLVKLVEQLEAVKNFLG